MTDPIEELTQLAEDQGMMDHLRQGNLVGHLWQKGVIANPVYEDDEVTYTADTLQVRMADPINEGKTLCFTLVTKEWRTE